jgi:hypothetical protein
MNPLELRRKRYIDTRLRPVMDLLIIALPENERNVVKQWGNHSDLLRPASRRMGIHESVSPYDVELTSGLYGFTQSFPEIAPSTNNPHPIFQEKEGIKLPVELCIGIIFSENSRIRKRHAYVVAEGNVFSVPRGYKFNRIPTLEEFHEAMATETTKPNEINLENIIYVNKQPFTMAVAVVNLAREAVISAHETDKDRPPAR